MRKTPRIDWPQLLRDLDAIGLSPVAVADLLGIARSTPYRWIEGSEPLYSHGAGVLVLHSERCAVRHSETEPAQHPARIDKVDKGAKK
jgi:hypothetical protein